jgi:pimeloyl-ACP methyl ester carboxylesterase
MEVKRTPTRNIRDHIYDLRGASRLAIEATRGVTELVEAVHTAIASGPVSLGRPFARPAEVTGRLVYGSIRGVMQLVGNTLDVALTQLAPLLAPGVPGVEREAVLAALNGVLGDYLSETHNPLAIEMQLRHGGEPLELTPAALRDELLRATGKLLVLVHGLCLTERRWTRRGHDHGASLARDLGYTPIYVRYNTGLPISTNGRLFATQLEQLASAWPVPLEEIVLLGHSMGGLVARSACHAGEVARHTWRTLLRSLITLGSPHHGAPLERGIQGIDRILGISSYSAPFRRLGRIRSAGITDLRYGNVLDEHWQSRDRFAQPEERRRPLPLPAGVDCYAIAGTLAITAATRQRGDGMVPVDSALGRHASDALTLRFPESHCAIIPATSHLDLLSSNAVYARLRSWLSSPQE